jgi:hypothetical protein
LSERISRSQSTRSASVSFVARVMLLLSTWASMINLGGRATGFELAAGS